MMSLAILLLVHKRIETILSFAENPESVLRFLGTIRR